MTPAAGVKLVQVRQQKHRPDDINHSHDKLINCTLRSLSRFKSKMRHRMHRIEIVSESRTLSCFIEFCCSETNAVKAHSLLDGNSKC